MKDQTIKSMTGAGQIEIKNFVPYYAGMPVDNLQADEDKRNAHSCYVIGNNFVLGKMHLSNEDKAKVMEAIEINNITVDRYEGRYVVHFLNIAGTYEEALHKAKGGKKFHNKRYGGGVAFDYNRFHSKQDFKQFIFNLKNN